MTALASGAWGQELDSLVDDERALSAPDAIALAATGERVLAAGATRYPFQPDDDHCFLYADPAGHPFCLSTWDLPKLGDA